MTEGYHRKNVGTLVTLLNQIAGDPWTKYAKCGVDSDRWFPSRPDSRDIEAAIQICNSCPVREQCLSEALSRNERWGIWGGRYFGSEDGRAVRLTKAMQDANRTHCKRGHAFTPENSYIKNGKSLACRKCQAIHDRNRRLRKTEAS